LIPPDVERRLWRVIQSEAESLGGEVSAVGGVGDHVHLLLSIPATLALSSVVKQVKGVSSLFANNELGFEGSFKWQSGYGAFSVSPWDVTRVRGYVQNQREHHESGTAKPQLELPPE
jgi:putative transposase